jgi:hypothetical protein
MAANKYAHVKTGANEYIKSYITYDASSRMEYVYEARANALDGESCLRTQYVYDGLTTNVVKMCETESTWATAYDI